MISFESKINEDGFGLLCGYLVLKDGEVIGEIGVGGEFVPTAQIYKNDCDAHMARVNSPGNTPFSPGFFNAIFTLPSVARVANSILEGLSPLDRMAIEGQCKLVKQMPSEYGFLGVG